MPRDLQNIINVVTPYGFERSSPSPYSDQWTQRRNVSPEYCQQRTNSPTLEGLSNLQYQTNLFDQSGLFQSNCKSGKVSGFRYEFNRVCRAAKFLPDPVAKALDADKKVQLRKSYHPKGQLKALGHYDHETRPSLMYFTPKPSQIFPTRKDIKLIDEVEQQRSRNRCVQAPLTTVCVFISKMISLSQAIEYLRTFGEIDNVTQHGLRSYRIVYSNLLSACEAVRNSDNRFIQCSWHHRGLRERRFIRRKRQALHVITQSTHL